jgi:hypothetical protein
LYNVCINILFFTLKVGLQVCLDHIVG